MIVEVLDCGISLDVRSFQYGPVSCAIHSSKLYFWVIYKVFHCSLEFWFSLLAMTAPFPGNKLLRLLINDFRTTNRENPPLQPNVKSTGIKWGT
jgi:hypothetical protein